LGKTTNWKEKLTKNQSIYTENIIGKTYLKNSFENNYTHYILVLDQTYKDIEKSKLKGKLQI